MSSISPLYYQCGAEGDTCTITSPESIAYVATDGTGDIYYRNSSKNFICHSDSFKNQWTDGDPSPNHVKICKSAQIPPDIANPNNTFYDSNGNPSGWQLCGKENDICNPNGSTPVDMLYGAQKAFFYANASSAACNEKIFGDPNPNIQKACYWRAQGGPVPPPQPKPSRVPFYVILGVGSTILIIIIILIILTLIRK